MVYMLLLLALLAAGGYTVSNVLEYTENVNTNAFKNYRFTTESATPDRIGPGIIQIPGVLGSALAKLGFGSIDCPNGGQYNNNRCEAQPQTTQVDAGIPYMCSTTDRLGRPRLYRWTAQGDGLAGTFAVRWDGSNPWTITAYGEPFILRLWFLNVVRQSGSPPWRVAPGWNTSADIPLGINNTLPIIGTKNGQNVEGAYVWESPDAAYFYFSGEPYPISGMNFLVYWGVYCHPNSPYYQYSSQWCNDSGVLNETAKGIGYFRFYKGLVQSAAGGASQVDTTALQICWGFTTYTDPVSGYVSYNPANCVNPENVSSFYGRPVPSANTFSVTISGPGVNGTIPIQNFINMLDTPSDPIRNNCVGRTCDYIVSIYHNGTLYAMRVMRVGFPYYGNPGDIYYYTAGYPCRGQISFGCLDGESYDPNTGMCKKNVYTCPSGYTLDGNVCVANPVINYKAISITWN